MLQWFVQRKISPAGTFLLLAFLTTTCVFFYFYSAASVIGEAALRDDNYRPLAFAQGTKLSGGDTAPLDQFGSSVAIDGDYALVGANRDDEYRGSAYIFVRDGSSWTQRQKLVPPDSSVEDNFGGSVAIDGDTAVVGAFLDDSPGPDQGSAYIYVRKGASWSLQQKIVAADGSGNDQFGISVSISGDTILVGSVGSQNSRGAAYVFVRSGSTWQHQQKLTAADGAINDEFGWSVSLQGNTAVVGSPGDEAARGSVVVFSRTGNLWNLDQKLMASDGTALDRFGFSLDVAGSSIISGSVNDEFGGTPRGSAYVFALDRGSWMEVQKLIAPDGDANDQYGSSVGLSLDRAIVGANGDDVNSASDLGSVYVYSQNGSQWVQSQKLSPLDAAEGKSFGSSIAIDGRYAIIGSYLDDATGIDSGSAYVFEDPSGGPTPTPTPTGIEGDTAPRPQGDGELLVNDLIQLRRFVVGQDLIIGGSGEFQRADIAPISALGDGSVDALDVVQSRRDIVRLDAIRSAGGPVQPAIGSGAAKWMLRAPDMFASETRLTVPEIVVSPGEGIVLPIFIADGSRASALSFTLVFDPKVVSNPSVLLADSTSSDVRLTTNSIESRMGRIGILVDSHREISPVNGVLLKVLFEIEPGSGPSDSTIKITGDVAPLCVSDPFARPVAATVDEGSVDIRPRFSGRSKP